MGLPNHINEEIVDHLEAIAELFKNPKITLVVRAPDLVDGDVVVTTDDFDLAIKAINGVRSRPAEMV